MAVKPIGTTALTWGSLLGRGNREPIDATQLNYSYTDLLWELNQRTVSYQIGANNGGSGNYYVGLITAVPYVNEDDKRKDSHYTVDANGNKKLETIDMKGPWYVSYKGTDKGRGTAKNKYGFVPDGNPNTYYADRIVLKQEMDYTLDNGFVRKTQLGTYYTGVGHWYDSYTKSKTYANGLECPDGVYFPTTSYAEIFNDYTHNVATGIFSHAEGTGSYTNGANAHAENSSYANGKNSHSGGEATAGGVNSFAHGVKGTLASGANSIALVSGTSSGEGSVAMNYSKATGKGSVAIGLGTIASGEYSLSQGHETRANNHDSHAEGYGTHASGDQSHTEGIVTTTNGLASHAEGQGSTTGTNATAAHAEGSYTIANNESEHAQGKYNVSDTENSGTLFTIGNGTANNKRHNVVGIYHNGDINIEGPNTTNHNTGYFKTTVDGSHTEVVRGNYTQTIGTASKNNTCNITVNGNTTNRFNGTSDTRTTGATYEGYGSTFISTTKGAKYIYSYSTTYIHSNDNVTNTTAGTRTNITDGYVSETNKGSIGTYTTGTTYQYTSGSKTDAVLGPRTNISSSTVRVTNKTNVIITTGWSHTESITDERSVTVGTHDSLTVNYGGRTEKITGEKITQVVLGNINAYTDDYHDTRLHTRSTYVETVHTYIGDKTNTYISGNYSIGLGQGIKVSSNTNVSTGKFNKDEASYFAVGIGISDTNRKNAFWISQGTTAGTNGVGYFSNNTYIYGNTYDPSQYPNNKEDKSWSVAVTYNMYRNSYTYLYNTVNDKFNNIFPRLAYLEKWCMWQSGLPNNKSTYIWSGTLAQFNSLTSKPENTTFIISN